MGDMRGIVGTRPWLCMIAGSRDKVAADEVYTSISVISNHEPSIVLLPRQLLQPVSLDPKSHPLLLLLRANQLALIKLQTRLIPVQTTPFQPLPAHVQHLIGQALQQRNPIPFLAVRRLNEQVLEVYPRHASPGAEVVEIERHAADRAVGVGEEEGFRITRGECGGCGIVVREGGGQGGDGGFDGGRSLFVVGEFLDEAEDCGDV
jgi:predicted nuclease with RNAse H fold